MTAKVEKNIDYYEIISQDSNLKALSSFLRAPCKASEILFESTVKQMYVNWFEFQ